MKRTMKLLISTMFLITISITTVAFAASSVVKDTNSSIDGQLLVLKISDDRIIAQNVDVLFTRVGKDDQNIITNYVQEIAKSENKVVECDSIKYRIYDGYIMMEIPSNSNIAGMFGIDSQYIKLKITLINGEEFYIEGKLIGNFDGVKDAPLDNGESYLFTDYRFTSFGWPFESITADPFYDEVVYLKAIGVVKGTTEGYLFPDSNITLKEFIAMMSRALQYIGRARNNDLTRVYGANMVDNEYDSWVKDDYAKLMNLWGTQSGETTDRGKAVLTRVLNVEQNENLNSSVTRAEAAIMLGALFKEPYFTNEQVQNSNLYDDWDTVKDKALIHYLAINGLVIDHWNLDTRTAIEEVPIKDLVEPDKELTRIQAMRLIFNMIKTQRNMEFKQDPFVTPTGNAAQTVINLPKDNVTDIHGQLYIHVKNPLDNIAYIRYFFGDMMVELPNTWENNLCKKNGNSSDPEKEFAIMIDAPNQNALYKLGVSVITGDGSMSEWAEKDINVILLPGQEQVIRL